jgi:hypothetical protein
MQLLTARRTITTSGASTATVTAITRTLVTETVTAPASTTPAAIRARAVAAAYAVASEIITSVIQSGTDGVATAPAVAVTGLSQGCSILNVDPTSTVTSTFTAPASVSKVHFHSTKRSTLSADNLWSEQICQSHRPIDENLHND